jgi:arylsulfatase A-like enzyme
MRLTLALILMLIGGVAVAAPPNIVFILADDLGYGDLGCYGQEIVQTPHIDTLADQGMRFTSAYAGSTVCAPSRCALMTGMHMGHAHIRGNKRIPLRPEDTTVAQVLGKAGYHTGLIGKWGLGEPDTTGVPTRQGFDYFFGYLNQRHAHTYYPTYLWRNENRVVLGNEEREENVASLKVDYSHDLVTDEALDFVSRHHDAPFFLYLAYTIPHANNEGGRATGDGMEVPDYGIYADKDWKDPQKGHAAMITRMDRDIGRLMALLDQHGIAENTVVFFSSDNGPHREGGADPEFFDSNGELRGIKRDLYEGGIRVPAIVRWPGVVPEGTVSDTPWAFWDFLPTAAAIAGAQAPDAIDGISIMPTLKDPNADLAARDYLYWEFHEGGFSQAIREGKWKAVRSKQGADIELYNLMEDRSEENDLATDHPEKVAHFEALLANARTESEFWQVRQ